MAAGDDSQWALVESLKCLEDDRQWRCIIDHSRGRDVEFFDDVEVRGKYTPDEHFESGDSLIWQWSDKRPSCVERDGDLTCE